MSTRPSTSIWTAAQALSLAAASTLVAGLWFRPELSLRVLWGGIIPALPIIFLVHPGLWRNVCPLATLNMASARFGRGRAMNLDMTRLSNTVGIGLFAVLVPLRGSIFEVSGPATAAAILALAALAVGGGVLFDRKAGYCNAICPLLAIERLYGHEPLLAVSNPRCPTCTLCVRRGCLDLSRRKSVAQTLGRRRRTPDWVREPFGMFAAAFPGFVVAFYLIPSDAPVLVAWCTVLAGAAFSWLVTAAICRAFALPAARVMPVVATVSLFSFYWFTSSRVAAAWDAGVAVTWAVRGVAMVGWGLWIGRRMSKIRRRPSANTETAATAGWSGLGRSGSRISEPHPSAT